MRFTDAGIRSLAPRAKRYDVFHKGGQGLGLRVEPNGRKTWFTLYRFDTRTRRLTLGTYQRATGFPVRMSLAAAQSQHRQALEQVAQGVDPAQERSDRREALRADAAQRKTVSQLLDEYQALEAPALKSGNEAIRILNRDVPDAWLRRHADTITMREVVLLIDDIRAGRGRPAPAPSAADHFQSRIVRLFAFAAERGIVKVSPLLGLRRRGKRSNGRARVLSDAECATMFAALHQPDQLDMSPAVADALLFLLTTGQRPGDVVGLAWSELDGVTWTIPAARYKTGTDQVVPLSPQALAILERRKLDPVAHAFAFPNPRGTFPHRTRTNRGSRDPLAGGQRPIIVSALSRAMRRNRGALGLGAPATPHDLRRTMRTGLSALRVDYITAELVIGHKLPTQMGQIYDRHNYLDAKREALERWATHLASAPEAARVAA